MRVQRGTRVASAAMAGVALLGVLAACSDNSTPDATTSTKPSASTSASATTDCADVTALKDSLDALTQVNPLTYGTDALNAAIADVKSSLDAAAASTSATLQPQVDDVKTAFAALETAVTGLTADNLTQKAPEIKSALTELGTATKTLGTSITDNCATN